MDDEKRGELQRLGRDPGLGALLNEVDSQIIAEWLATNADQATRREQLWHELAGAGRLRAMLKSADDDELIANARSAADEGVDREPEEDENA